MSSSFYAVILPYLDLVERRDPDVHVPLLKELSRVPEQKGHQQHLDVGSVHVSVREDDHPPVPQPVDAGAPPASQPHRENQVGQLLVLQQRRLIRLLNVQNLSPQRQHGLKLPVPRLLGRTPGGVPLHDEELGLRCVPGDAIR